MDDIDGIGIGYQGFHEPSLAIEKAAEDIDQTHAHAETKEGFPEGVGKRLPMPAAHKRRMIFIGAADQYQWEPQKDKEDGNSRPEAARFVRQGQKPVTPVGNQPDNKQDNILRKERELKIQRSKAPTHRMPQAYCESGNEDTRVPGGQKHQLHNIGQVLRAIKARHGTPQGLCKAGQRDRDGRDRV